MISRFLTIQQPTEALFKDKGSKFLAYAYPVENAEEVRRYLNELREQHPKAVHHCYAYRLGADGQDFRANDDGEPSGSAGRPILGQIDSLNLVNVLVVVVRYFGGVLLGVPGLINAYKTSSQEALEQADVVEQTVMEAGELRCEYHSLGEILNIIKSTEGEVTATEMAYDCQVFFKIPLENLALFSSKMEKFYSIDFKFHR